MENSESASQNTTQLRHRQCGFPSRQKKFGKGLEDFTRFFAVYHPLCDVGMKKNILISAQVFCWQKLINLLGPKPQNFRDRSLKFCGFGPAFEKLKIMICLFHRNGKTPFLEMSIKSSIMSKLDYQISKI